MSVIDVLTRVDALCKKYEKYDLEKQRETSAAAGGDAFLKLYTVLQGDVDAALEKADDVKNEKNRAVVATLNAEIRRSKNALRNEIPKLQRLAAKKVKGLSKEELAVRPDLATTLAQRIEDIPDGTTLNRRAGNGAWKDIDPAKRNEIKIDIISPEDRLHPEHYQETAESKGYRQDFEQRKALQDQNLDYIADGLSTLKNMAEDINEEIDRQAPLIDEIDTKVDKAAMDLKNTNVRLKEVVTKMRTSRNFCIDIVLLIIVLGIAAYLYQILK